ncbi:MAG: stage III sporulation protein AB [Lachnospiraceae bacterium]|nr:stage III sporulation protein AB [Lachnospiraceae bacterium]
MNLQFVLKFTGAILIIAGSAGYGYSLAARYGQRLRELEQLRQMIFLLKGQITYASAPLQEAFEVVGDRTEGALSRLFGRVAGRIEAQQGEAFYRIWQEEVAGSEQDGLAMEQSDRQVLGELGEHLGFLDKEMQERNLLLYLEQLDLRIGDLRAHKTERCRIYSSLGIMGGLFLTILLV